jgi:chemotaxis protein MotB
MAFQLRRRPDDDDEHVTTFWLITYSDMTTLLLAFFLLMYSFTLLNERRQDELVRSLNVVERGGERKAAPRADLEEKARQIAAQFARDETWVESSPTEVTVGMPSAVTFALGDASLSEAARAPLARVAGILAGVPNVVRVEGHTDNLPMRGARYPSNWHLSVARAQAVVRLLMEKGVDPRRLEVVGYGETRPRQPNDSEEGRAANRRIELKLLREK